VAAGRLHSDAHAPGATVVPHTEEHPNSDVARLTAAFALRDGIRAAWLARETPRTH